MKFSVLRKKLVFPCKVLMKISTYLVNNSFKDSGCLCYACICSNMIPKSCTSCCHHLGPEDWRLSIKMLKIPGPCQCGFPEKHWWNVPARSHPTLSWIFLMAFLIQCWRYMCAFKFRHFSFDAGLFFVSPAIPCTAELTIVK